MAATALVLGGCGGSSDRGVYRASAEAALRASLSDARTAELAGRLWLVGRSTVATTSVIVKSSEEGAGGEAAWFAGQQPPPAADELRDETSTALSDTEKAVSQLRIAVARSDRQAAASAADSLQKATAAAESLAEELQ